MNKLNLTLKCRITLLSVIIMIITSVVLVTSINLDIKKNIPGIKYEIGKQIDNNNNVVNQSLGKLEGSGEVSIEENSPGSTGYITCEGVIQTAVTNIYYGSIIALIITIILGAITTYFVVDKALNPVKNLNKKIKNINENNLFSNIEVSGPQDEIKQLAISFNQMLGKLENAFISQKRFNSNVTHELKTPLATIKTNIDVLNDQTNKDINDYIQTIDIIEKSIIKMNRIIDTLLDIVRDENLSLDDIVNIPNIIEDILEDLDIISQDKGIKLNYICNSSISNIKGNEILLYRALYNIIENSIKYNKENGIVNIYCEENKENIKIIISDNGIGIKKDSIKNIFEPFYRENKYDTNSKGSLGLGLSLTKSAILIHSGNINVDSELDKGTCTTVTLPIIQV